jgi:hypothetical protein
MFELSTEGGGTRGITEIKKGRIIVQTEIVCIKAHKHK